MNDLEWTTKCQAEGCDWHVFLPATRCAEHGGDKRAHAFRYSPWAPEVKLTVRESRPRRPS